MEMDSKHGKILRVGSRKSELALIQTNYVIDCMKKLYDDVTFEIVTMTTLGDRILNVSLPKIGEKSLFTKDLEDALHIGTVDFVVHSLKDLPTTLPNGLAIGAVLEREDPRDAVVIRDDLKEHTLDTLPPYSCIGTSSLRRTAQLRALYPHLRVADVRGNLNTRLRKLQQHSGSTDASACGDIEKVSEVNASGEEAKVESTEYAALILAASGLARMGWQHKISQVLPCSRLLYAAGQGALAVECRAGNSELLHMLSPLNHPESYLRALVERSFLKTLGGGCSAPVGVSTSLKPFNEQYKLSITGAVWSLDGLTKVGNCLDQIFPQIRRYQTCSKHKLSPTASEETKRLKTDVVATVNAEMQFPAENPVEEYNQRIGDRRNLNCEDVRSPEEIKSLVNLSDNEVGKPYENLTGAYSVNEPGFSGDCENGKNNTEVKIFCGMSENFNILYEVIEQCELIGINLANKLIEKGALEVMKVSQDYIRSSVKV